MSQLSFVSGEAVALPPFRSAKYFPASPKPEKARALYPECLQALRDSNEARRILRASMDSKKMMMDEIRKEIAKLEQDLTLEAGTRMRLHAMNEALINALVDIDAFAEEVTHVVAESHRTSRTGLGGMIDKLKALPRRWKAFKAVQRQTIASALAPRDDGGLRE
jgi:hypothetical protein